jgi:hypothetical protein
MNQKVAALASLIAAWFVLVDVFYTPRDAFAYQTRTAARWCNNGPAKYRLDSSLANLGLPAGQAESRIIEAAVRWNTAFISNSVNFFFRQ